MREIPDGAGLVLAEFNGLRGIEKGYDVSSSLVRRPRLLSKGAYRAAGYRRAHAIVLGQALHLDALRLQQVENDSPELGRLLDLLGRGRQQLPRLGSSERASDAARRSKMRSSVSAFGRSGIEPVMNFEAVGA